MQQGLEHTAKKNVKKELKKWNREVFRHTEKRKKQLLCRLDGINKAVSRRGLLPKYEELQLAIWKELEDVLLQESLILA